MSEQHHSASDGPCECDAAGSVSRCLLTCPRRTQQPTTSGTRYLCPMPGCGWHHDELDGRLPATWPAVRFEDGIEAGFAALVEHAVIERAGRVEVAIEQHLAAGHANLDYVTEMVRLQRFVQQLRDLHHEGHGSFAMAGGGSMESDSVCPSCGVLWPCPTGGLLEALDSDTNSKEQQT